MWTCEKPTGSGLEHRRRRRRLSRIPPPLPPQAAGRKRSYVKGLGLGNYTGRSAIWGRGAISASRSFGISAKQGGAGVGKPVLGRVRIG